MFITIYKGIFINSMTNIKIMKYIENVSEFLTSQNKINHLTGVSLYTHYAFTNCTLALPMTYSFNNFQSVFCKAQYLSLCLILGVIRQWLPEAKGCMQRQAPLSTKKAHQNKTQHRNKSTKPNSSIYISRQLQMIFMF